MADTRLKELSLFDPEIVRPAVWESFRKLVPQHVIKNPVMFVVEIGSVLTTLILLRDLMAPTAGSQSLWFTANVASGFGLPSFSPTSPKRSPKAEAKPRRRRCARCGRKPPRGDWSTATVKKKCRRRHCAKAIPLSSKREMIPGDGDVIEGIASVDESAITGESAPVIRESGGDRSAVTGGTKVLSDRIVVRITASPANLS